MRSKILLAEDHDANRAVLKRRLERRGYSVIEAENGAVAVALFEAQAPDLVLMDVSMPVMDGMEALVRIRTAAFRASTPVVALTAHAMHEMRAQCNALGFNAFVTKPIEFDDLIVTIEALSGCTPNVAS